MTNVERPILILPEPKDVTRAKRNPVNIKISRPGLDRQKERLDPQFRELDSAFNRRKIALQDNPDGLEPELALVFVTIGSRANFKSAVQNIEGFEWLVETALEEIDPDDDFYYEGDKEKPLNGKYYCIMSNQKALRQMLSLWKRYQRDPTTTFARGLASFKDLFASLKEVRTWSAADRFADTGILEQWREDVEVKRGTKASFEIELFYRRSTKAQEQATIDVRSLVEEMGGSVKKSCIINEIEYHGLLVDLPPEAIQKLLDVDQWANIRLVQADHIMFFRPVAQTIPGIGGGKTGIDGPPLNAQSRVIQSPVVALLDGFPVANHQLLQDRLIVDDPDGIESLYQVEQRVHGTAMASLIMHGDLNDPEHHSIERSVYLRPILQPDFNNETYLDDELIVDVVHRAVKRMIEGDGNEPPAARSVKVINLSIGDSTRQYLNSVSPLARLLDWLSYKYQILFIVSSGNNLQPCRLSIESMDYVNMTQEKRTYAVVDSIKRNNRNIRLFSPSESINALTVGALFSDHCNEPAQTSAVYPVDSNMPHPISALGPGVRRMIKPEILVPGGRLRTLGLNSNGELLWTQSASSGPGCKVAYPKSNQPLLGEGYTVGTSASAALASHAAGQFYEILENVFLDSGEPGIPEGFEAIMLKAMLVHGASWQLLEKVRDVYYDVNRQQADRWFGYGIPDFARVRYCTDNRVTAIGYGKIKNEHGQEFRFPLPINLAASSISRKLTVTLAYFSPIAPGRQEYRKAQIWFSLDDETERLVPERENTDRYGVLKGTVQHEILTGCKPIPWGLDDEIVVKVNCKQGASTGAIGASIPYAIFVTMEIGNPIGNIYDGIAQKIRKRVTIRDKQ